jgi:hypothetical protein
VYGTRRRAHGAWELRVFLPCALSLTPWALYIYLTPYAFILLFICWYSGRLHKLQISFLITSRNFYNLLKLKLFIGILSCCPIHGKMEWCKNVFGLVRLFSRKHLIYFMPYQYDFSNKPFPQLPRRAVVSTSRRPRPSIPTLQYSSIPIGAKPLSSLGGGFGIRFSLIYNPFPKGQCG